MVIDKQVSDILSKGKSVYYYSFAEQPSKTAYVEIKLENLSEEDLKTLEKAFGKKKILLG